MTDYQILCKAQANYIKELEEIIDEILTDLGNIKDEVERTIGSITVAEVKAQTKHSLSKP